jgi:hypothetical protein
LSCGFGSGARVFYPGAPGAVPIVPGLLIVSALGLLWTFVRAPALRLRALRVAALAGGGVCLMVGITWARVATAAQGLLFVSRYGTLVIPLLCAAYLSWEVFPGVQVRRFMQMVCFLFAAMVLLPNKDAGVAEAAYLKNFRISTYEDLRAGVPLNLIAERHCYGLYVCDRQPPLAERMQWLRDSGFGPFVLPKEKYFSP